MMTLHVEQSVQTARKFQSLAHTRAERFSALFEKHPDAVVVRRETAGGNVLYVLAFCAERNFQPLAVWCDEIAVEVALTSAQYEGYLQLMSELASRENGWTYLQIVYWKDIERPAGWCWMQIPEYDGFRRSPARALP